MGKSIVIAEFNVDALALKDITKRWVIDHFDIKESQDTRTVKQFIGEIDERGVLGEQSMSEFLDKIESSFPEGTEIVEVTDGYEGLTFSAYRHIETLENYDDVVGRIQTEIKSRIKKINTERSERAELLRLQAKYGDQL